MRLNPASPVVIFTDFQRGSYEVIGRITRLTLQSIGINVTERQTPESDDIRAGYANDLAGSIILHNTIGPLFEPLPGSINIALPFHEWNRYPKGWVRKLNRFDEVWVTSDHMRRLMIESGVTQPVELLAPALDLDEMPGKTDWNANRPFRFFSCGEPHFRKGFHLLMEGFMEAFPDPGEAELWIKTSPGCAWKPPVEHIRIISERLSRNKMLSLYKDFDVYVTASLAEGLGLPIAEASLARLPVAANYWGGHTSLLCEDAFFRIEHDVVDQPFCSDPSYYAVGQQCALSRPGMIARSLRAAFSSTAEERRKMAETAREFVIANYGSHVCQERYKKRFGM